MTGTYTEIVNLIVPASAVPGEAVTIEVQVKNIHPATIAITATGALNSTPIYFGNIGRNVDPGAMWSFYESFIMPDHDVTIHAWSWYLSVTGWAEDDHAIASIFAGEAPPDGYPTSDIADFNIMVPTGTYGLGSAIDFTGVYKHKGVAIEGSLTIMLGTGVFPTFLTAHTFDPVPVSFLASVDWKAASLAGSIVLPATLTPGQTYSVRATLRTNDGAQETDTDWGVITVIEAEELETLRVNVTPVGKGYVTTVPASEEGKTTWHDEQTGKFPYGTNVEVTAVPYNGYVFEKWSSEIVGGVSYQNPEYVQPMTEHRAVKAHFREEGLPGERLVLSDMTVIDYYKKV